MKFSTLKEIQNSTTTVDTFGGYNHNIKIPEGEFYDMKNMTSDFYPVLSPRCKRGLIHSSGTHKINGIIAKDELCYVDGTKMFVGTTEVENFSLTDSHKTLVSMGAYIIILPDKKYVNTKDLTDKGSIESSYESTTTVTYTMCRVDGSQYENVTVSATTPSNPSNLAYWIDTSSDPHELKQYSKASTSWTTIATTYVRIACKDIAKEFAQYDGVKISGIDSSITQLQDLEGQTSVLYEVHRDESGNGAGDYVVVIGFLDAVKTQTSALTLQRQMPILDYVIESGNRLWGCRYGEDNDGNVVNEIYASKLGDFKNWNSYMGISTDSYSASCGTDGEWTGAVTHLGYPLFFKENQLHKVYGNIPSNFQIQNTELRGVMKGASKSLAILNEKLIYKSRYGVCSYDGSLPTEISYDFGGIKYSATDTGDDGNPIGAVAGTNGSKYFISMKSEEDNKWYLLVYDSLYDTWHKEDDLRVDAFASVDGEMYFIDHKDHQLKTVLGTGTKESAEVEWMVESGIIGTTVKESSRYTTQLPMTKYVSKMLMRMALSVGSTVMLYIQYDSTGEWEHLSTMKGTSLKSFYLPIKPKRCDHFRIRIVGKGDAKIYSITKAIEKGSDI